jgi:hypothetical protein
MGQASSCSWASRRYFAVAPEESGMRKRRNQTFAKSKRLLLQDGLAACTTLVNGCVPVPVKGKATVKEFGCHSNIHRAKEVRSSTKQAKQVRPCTNKWKLIRNLF